MCVRERERERGRDTERHWLKETEAGIKAQEGGVISVYTVFLLCKPSFFSDVVKFTPPQLIFSI